MVLSTRQIVARHDTYCPTCERKKQPIEIARLRLLRRRRAILRYIQQRQLEKRIPPTIREIGMALGVPWKTIKEDMTVLVAGGFLRARPKASSRTWVVVG